MFVVGVRKLLDKVFTSEELRILDDILPSFRRHEHLDDEDKKVINSQSVNYASFVINFVFAVLVPS